MVSPSILIRIKSRLLSKKDGSTRNNLIVQNEKENILHSWLNTTKLLMGTGMVKTKSNSVKRFIEQHVLSISSP